MEKCHNCIPGSLLATPEAKWPNFGWKHWDGKAISISVIIATPKFANAARWAINAWNTIQNRFYLKISNDLNASIHISEYSDNDGYYPSHIHDNKEFWIGVQEATIIRDENLQRIGRYDNKLIANAEVWMNADAFSDEDSAREEVAHGLGHTLGLSDIFERSSSPSIMSYPHVWDLGEMWPTDDDVKCILNMYGVRSAFTKPEEYFGGISMPRIIIKYWDPATTEWYVYDSFASEYTQTLKHLHRGMQLFTQTHEPITVMVGSTELHIRAGKDIVEWPAP